ncbi:MAG: hypothetical protein HC941_29710 [Microcoleus sp. SU_5_3]|nr:hypothetical protein [Microcoleus sp. SU_5_3]
MRKSCAESDRLGKNPVSLGWWARSNPFVLVGWDWGGFTGSAVFTGNLGDRAFSIFSIATLDKAHPYR